MISKLFYAAPFAACLLLAGCGDSGLPVLGGAHWRMVEDQDQLTGHPQSHAALTTDLEGGGHVELEARCEGEPGPGAGLRVSGEIRFIGPRIPFDPVTQWRAAAGSQTGAIGVTLTGQDGFNVSVLTNEIATVEPSDMNAALLGSGQTVRAEVAREGDDPVLNFRNTDDAFQAMVRRCRLRAAQGVQREAQQTGPAPAPAVEAPAPAAPAPTQQPASSAPRPIQRMMVAPSNPNSGPAPLPPGAGQIAPLPPGAR